jgi:3-keto-5-aminohexanoate cleavage enzyme
MAGRNTWLEVALNGPWSRERQPGIPIATKEIIEQGVACAKAGAAIIHVHAYDEQSGRQRDDPDLYAAIIEGIRGKEDVIVYPTIPFAGDIHAPDALSAQARFAHTEELARRGLIEWAAVDPGTTYISRYDDIANGKKGFIYANPEEHVRQGLTLGERYKFHPGYAIYEPAFIRLGAALHRASPDCPRPIYRFMFSSGFTFGFPPETYAIDAYLKLLEREAPGAPWMVAGLDVDVTPLMDHTIKHGGHLRVGLEDAPFGSQWTNLQWVETAIGAIHAAGSAPATAKEIRAALAAS